MPDSVVAHGTVNDRYLAPPNVVLWLCPDGSECFEHVAYFVPVHGEGSDPGVGSCVLETEIGQVVTVSYLPTTGKRLLTGIAPKPPAPTEIEAVGEERSDTEVGAA